MPQVTEGTAQDERPLTIADAAERLHALRSRQGKADDEEAPDSEDATEDSASVEVDEEVEETEQDADSTDETDAGTESDAEEPEQESELSDEDFDRLVRARKHRARSNNEDLEVDYDELLAGFSRTDDYTRKTQAAAELKKQAEAERKSAAERRTLYDERLKQAEDALKVMMPEEPDWDTVRRDHPAEYPALYTDWKRYQERLVAVQNERKVLADEEARERSEQHLETVKGEFEKLLAAVPEWRDEKVRAKEFAKVVETAKSYGLGDEDVASMVDHRGWRILRDAMRYQDLVKAQKAAKSKIDKVGPGSVKTGKPGGALARRPDQSAATKAFNRLAKSGDPADAAEVLSHIRRAEEKRKKR